MQEVSNPLTSIKKRHDSACIPFSFLQRFILLTWEGFHKIFFKEPASNNKSMDAP